MTRWTDVPQNHAEAIANGCYPPIGELVRLNVTGTRPGSGSSICRGKWDGKAWRHKSGNLILGYVAQWQSIAPADNPAVGSLA